MLTHECPEHGRYDITHDTCPICKHQKQIQDGLAEIVHEEGFETKNAKVVSGATRLIADLINAIDPGAQASVGNPNRMERDDDEHRNR
tara:strand:- start:391 stop:654 length:264 start_codon:yes stop_codon:yes gene_type:complete